MRSSSHVDTPGFAAAQISSRIDCAIKPASRMRRISSRLFSWMRTAAPSAWSCGNASAYARALWTGEAFVVARDQVRLDLLHGIERDTDDDQQARAAEPERHLDVLLQQRGD